MAPILRIQSLLFISIIYLFLCTIHSKPGEYSYLIPGRNAFHVKLLEPTAFSRRIYKDIWIYKNGFVTVGNPLENENYPNLVERTVQPFESIAGYNIIAVFIMEYQMVAESMVRVRQYYPNSIEYETMKLLKSIELKIKEVHGKNVRTPFERMLEIEWIKMKPVGVDNNKKNTFRLFILSTTIQTFCVIHYMKVESSIYKLNGTTFPYQSGLSSYTEMKFILPLYNVTKTNNPLQESTNIGIENFWVITMGDTSYNVDLGWLPQKNINLESSSRENKVTKSQEKVRKDSLKEHSKYQQPSASFKIFKYPTNIFTENTSSTQKVTELPITFSSSEKFDQITSSMISITTSEKSNRKKTKSSISLSNQMNDNTIKTRLMTRISVKPKELLLSLDSAIGKNIPTYKRLMDEGVVSRQPAAKMPCPGKNICKHNEECFRFNEKSCCKCMRGTNLIEQKCVKNDELFYTKSQGIARMSSIGMKWNFDLTLLISKGPLGSNENYPRAHITLTFNDDLPLEIRNFLLLLYPLFHIPMAFYAMTWNDEEVANMNSLVDQMAGIHIYLAVGEYDQIYISFRLDRQQSGDIWNVSMNGFNIKKLKDLNLTNLRFDEKSTDSFTLAYSLINSNSIEFPEQTVLFQDESNMKYITIKWRGTMSFAATCLSNYIRNRKYYVKFSDKSYCNSDCIPEPEGKKSCRVMCLGSPHIFDRLPEPCEGNFCGQNQICVNSQERYECNCNEGMIEFEGRCINGHETSTPEYPLSRSTKMLKECEKCSINANCVSINHVECCSCKALYMGSGINCWKKDSQFELRFSGAMNIEERTISTFNSDKIINLLFRQYRSENGFHLASFIGLDQFKYTALSDQQLFHFILLLAPLFDVPLALFASGINQTEMKNIYALSNGQIKIEIDIESSTFSPINITMEFFEMQDQVQISVKVIGIPNELDPNWMIDSYEHFITRGGIGGAIRYSIEGNIIIFDKHRIRLPEKVKSYEMSWKGRGELHKCAHHVPKRNFLVMSTNQYDCNPKCQNNICKPYCQATTVLHELPPENPCLNSCKINENCVKGTCICIHGYSRNNSHCEPIKKQLECQHSIDCLLKPFMECKGNRCVCQGGYEFRGYECVKSEQCKFCGVNGVCLNGVCVCKKGFALNRISRQCVFDCSVCDPYSTSCLDNRCACLVGFRLRNNDTTHCDLACYADNDCPTHEQCTPSKICQCPYDKSNGICRPINGCEYCHKNALCIDGNCKCRSEWMGNGINCTYNCSLCYHPKYCLPESGCSCPSKFVGDGKFCKQTECIEECSNNSVCIQENAGFHCKCTKGYYKSYGNKCVKDLVELNIFPLSPQIDVNEGETVELFCMGSAKSAKFDLFWLRNSGRPVKGQSEYADSTNTTLKISLRSVNAEDSDIYVCGTESGSRKYITIQVNKEIGRKLVEGNCQGQCSSFARCENDKCKCVGNYIGDGIVCCSRDCSSSEMCNRKLGQCHCRSGFTNYKSKCVKDCRNYHHCDRNAKCNPNDGICECNKNFIGNGTNCWKQTNNCLLTRRCASNASCTIIAGVKQHLCICDPGFVGDGILYCYRQVDCNIEECGRNSFCEPFMVEDQFGSHILNGKCTCEPGYSRIDNKCMIKKESKITLWMSMGESIISRKIEQNISVIQYIEIARNSEVTGIITSIVGDCGGKRLVWAADNGMSIKSASSGNFSKVSTHISNLGKVMGMAVDETTGNIYFSDSYRGRIGLLNLDLNISKTLISLENYSPGPIVVHQASRKMFWIVNDYSNPRIEVAELNGNNHKVFLSLNTKAISLAIAFQNNSFDKICWVEVKNDMQGFQFLTASSTFGIIKCLGIHNQTSQPTIMHKISQEEPFSSLLYVDRQFYWNVRNGAFVRNLKKTERKIHINPNCCDVRVSSLTALENNCLTRNSLTDPCYLPAGTYKCPQLCVPVLNSNKMSQTCLDIDK